MVLIVTKISLWCARLSRFRGCRPLQQSVLALASLWRWSRKLCLRKRLLLRKPTHRCEPEHLILTMRSSTRYQQRLLRPIALKNSSLYYRISWPPPIHSLSSLLIWVGPWRCGLYSYLNSRSRKYRFPNRTEGTWWQQVHCRVALLKFFHQSSYWIIWLGYLSHWLSP